MKIQPYDYEPLRVKEDFWGADPLWADLIRFNAFEVGNCEQLSVTNVNCLQDKTCSSWITHCANKGQLAILQRLMR